MFDKFNLKQHTICYKHVNKMHLNIIIDSDAMTLKYLQNYLCREIT